LDSLRLNNYSDPTWKPYDIVLKGGYSSHEDWVEQVDRKCRCALHNFLGTYNGTYGGWADPRRGYLESEEDFLGRVPDGFLKWPEDCLGSHVHYDFSRP